MSASGIVTTSRQPPALYVLAMTETWERFSYYGMRAILILYMTEHLLLAGDHSEIFGLSALKNILQSIFGAVAVRGLPSEIYGLYTGFAYFTPIIGGVVADRWLGQRRSVVIGAILMALGQFALMSEHLFLVGLALLIAGNGLFKSNIVSQVGRLYADGDARRDRAYSIFYVGINIGACVAPLACGTVAQIYGWAPAFGLGGVGMLIGLGTFLAFGAHLPDERSAPRRETAPIDEPEQDVIKRIGLLAIIGAMLAIFFAVFEQLGNAFSLWMRDYTNHVIAGHNIPVPWFQSTNPLLMIALTPVLVALWAGRAKMGAEQSTIAKMTLGLTLMGTSYFILAGSSYLFSDQRISWISSLPFLLVLTWGELHISPTSLSLFSRLAPKQMLSTTMGMYFLCGFVGNIMAGALGAYWSQMRPEAYWTMIGVIALIGALGGFAMTGTVNRFLDARGLARS